MDKDLVHKTRQWERHPYLLTGANCSIKLAASINLLWFLVSIEILSLVVGNQVADEICESSKALTE